MAINQSGNWDLSVVAAAVSAAAIDPSRWRTAMDVVAAQTGSTGAVLVPVTGAIPHACLSDSLAGLSEAYLTEGWVSNDLRHRGAHLLRDQGVFDERHYTSEEEMRTHPYFQELLTRFDLKWSAMISMQAGDEMWSVAIQRSEAQGRFSNAELARLKSLADHFATAGAAARALGFARADAALAAFEVSGSPVVLLDRAAKVVRLNNSARALLGEELTITGGKLVPRDTIAARNLDRALHKLLWNVSDKAPPSVPVVIPRYGRAPLLAYPSRVENVTADALAPCQGIVVLQDPEARHTPQASVIKACFGLTDAEARVAIYIASGKTLSEIAATFAISKLTARNQLASAMDKMGLHRQVDLVATLSAMASHVGTIVTPKP